MAAVGGARSEVLKASANAVCASTCKLVLARSLTTQQFGHWVNRLSTRFVRLSPRIFSPLTGKRPIWHAI